LVSTRFSTLILKLKGITLKITKRQLQAALRESVFTPKDPGPLKAIVDVGNRDYYIRRAKEFLDLSLENGSYPYLTLAISLIALAKLTEDKK
jgi:hypothetical protein